MHLKYEICHYTNGLVGGLPLYDVTDIFEVIIICLINIAFKVLMLSIATIALSTSIDFQ